jgi:uncharacterized protein
VTPVGTTTADPLYEIADTYLAFWFGVIRDDVDLIEGGQGAAVRHRTAPRLEQHDVMGLSRDRTALLGECRWQGAPLAGRDLLELQRTLAYVPEPADDVAFMFWTRTGSAPPGFPATVYSAGDIVG